MDDVKVLRRAVHIAAVIMQAAGLCRYDSVYKCRRVYVDDSTCVKCIETWLIGKANQESRQEGLDDA